MVTKGGPDEQEFCKLANGVEQFAVCLVDPLKSDEGNRRVFGAGINHFADLAIEKGQKKVRLETVTHEILQYIIHTVG